MPGPAQASGPFDTERIMSTDPIIRVAAPGDADALSQMICAVLYASNLADYGEENIRRVAAKFTPEGVRAMIGDGRVIYVALCAGRIAGTASYALTDDPSVAHIKTFFVDACLQRQGIGACLYAALAARAAEDCVFRFTLRASLAGVPFYEKLGFVPVRELWDGTERTVEMRN